MRHSRWERSRGDIVDHGEGDSNAVRAATTARSTSTAEAWATWTRTCSVDGLTVSKVVPSLASTHSPSMSSCLGVERNSWTAGRRVMVPEMLSVVMGGLPWCGDWEREEGGAAAT